MPRTRLWPALRRSLARPRAGGLDVPALVRRLARAENIRRLPRRSRCASGGEVWVVIDRAQRLLPYDTDFDQIVGEVARLHGAASLRLWVVCESPDAVLWTRRGRGPEEGVRGRIPVPPPGTPVLILGDLGLLSGRGQAEAWVGFCRRLRDGGADPVAWLPLSPRLVSRQTARHARVHCLGGDLHLLRQARCAEAPPLPAAALDSLLTRLACCVRVEPALLRSLRLMHPDTAAEPGLEALVWGHPGAVTAGYRFCEIAWARQATYRARFAGLDAAAQDEILRRMLAAHAHRGRSTETVEALIWRAHTSRDAPPGEPAKRMAEAIAWLPRVAASAGAGLGDVAEYARDLMFRQGGDAALCRDNSPAPGAPVGHQRAGRHSAGVGPPGCGGGTRRPRRPGRRGVLPPRPAGAGVVPRAAGAHRPAAVLAGDHRHRWFRMVAQRRRPALLADARELGHRITHGRQARNGLLHPRLRSEAVSGRPAPAAVVGHRVGHRIAGPLCAGAVAAGRRARAPFLA
ncbi:MAG: hypothetical protein IPQ01_11205 [Zoogloea sp.]|nr:hypothetical protein [Zoogloea sp.]